MEQNSQPVHNSSPILCCKTGFAKPYADHKVPATVLKGLIELLVYISSCKYVSSHVTQTFDSQTTLYALNLNEGMLGKIERRHMSSYRETRGDFF